jgi:hypothetical protein
LIIINAAEEPYTITTTLNLGRRWVPWLRKIYQRRRQKRNI